MTRKTDMASRYAAAHARKEQRRREGPARQFLPLGDGGSDPMPPGTGVQSEAGTGGGAAVQSRLPAIDYSYLRGDLVRIAVLAAILFAGMIVLSFVIR